jgi:hypothetical protein
MLVFVDGCVADTDTFSWSPKARLSGDATVFGEDASQAVCGRAGFVHARHVAEHAMALLSIKDHPFYVRMKQLPPQEVAGWVLGTTPIQGADPALRKSAFRRVAKHITGGKAERAKYGFNSDTNGEIARAMEWAFQAGFRAANKG